MDGIIIDGVLIKWLGNSGFMIKGNGMVIYIDPTNISARVPEEDMADLLLITHEHFGHCDPESIRNVRRFDCTTLIPEKISLQFRGDARRVIEGDSLSGELNIKGVDIEVVSAYDSCDSSSSSGDGVGYFFVFAGLKIYHAGHTCAVPEMEITNSDIAFLPIGGHEVMDEVKAANAVLLLSPKTVVPMIYDSDDFDGASPDVFIDMVKKKSPSTKVVIL
ncbi:MBL fold metallo-hydrolase [Methanolobus sp. ZRKC5]|uniref:MBL fold metallo-hydrolase n=1 Tax=unclassified Methanolobus TaxID=2629569 RepID=UPI00313A7963